MAHDIVIKMKEMGLPQRLDGELATLSTDLGDLWGAQRALSARLEGLLERPHEWERVGDSLVDLRAGIDHMAWHLKSVRRPLNRITRYAFRAAQERQDLGDTS